MAELADAAEPVDMAEPARLPTEVVRALSARGETVATAESLTAGLLCARLTDVPGTSTVVRGGLIVYATDLKETLAGVEPALLAEHGPVHPEVAAQLAEGARSRCVAHWGIGLTGVAGPEPQGGAEAGTVHIGLVGPAVRTVTTLRLPGDRTAVRRGTVWAALEQLEEQLKRI